MDREDLVRFRALELAFLDVNLQGCLCQIERRALSDSPNLKQCVVCFGQEILVFGGICRHFVWHQTLSVQLEECANQHEPWS